MFVNGEFYPTTDDLEIHKKCSHTWKHSSHILDLETIPEYAYIWSRGNLEGSCPSSLASDWEKISKRVSAIMKSVVASKCDIENTCIYDYIPERYLKKYLSTKEGIINSIFSKREKPNDYQALVRAHILTEEMNNNKNWFDGKLKTTNYGIFGTKTGRLSNKQAGIPILTMKKEDRVKLKPTNDLFVEFDFNAAEIRTLLALGRHAQPPEDIHSWNATVVAKGTITRDQMKKRFFAWLYNPKSDDQMLSRYYDRDALIGTHWDGKSVKTPYGRDIPCDRDHALNYLLQSTSSDVCIEQAFKVRKIFQDCKTRICYLLHDSVVLDFAREDLKKFEEARKAFGETKFGNYMVSAKLGKNFKDMTEVVCTQ
jgi:hypothetical protein